MRKYSRNEKIKNRTMLKTAAFTLGILFSVGVYMNVSRAQVSSPSIALNPNSVSTQQNGTFTMTVDVNPAGNQLSSVQLYFSFDPTKVQLDSISGNSSLLPMELGNNIDNVNGTGLYASGIKLSPRTPITTTSTVATLTFHAVNNGASNINITDKSFVTILGDGSPVVTATATVSAAARVYTLADWQNVANHWLQDVIGEANGDYNNDGKANTRDVGVIMHSWQ